MSTNLTTIFFKKNVQNNYFKYISNNSATLLSSDSEAVAFLLVSLLFWKNLHINGQVRHKGGRVNPFQSNFGATKGT